jgi:hypothetical protein
MSKAKRHHFVPRAYQARFGVNDQVRVRRRGQPQPFTTNVINVAVQGGFNTITDEDGNASTFVEDTLAHLDDAGVQAMREIDRTGRPPALGTHGREVLCLYLAAQMVRIPRKRTMVLFPQEVTAYAKGRELDRALVAEYLERVHLGFTPQPSEVDGAWAFLHGVIAMEGIPSQDKAITSTLGPALQYTPYFRHRHWRLELSGKLDFLTSDAPLVLWKPHSKEDAYKGFGLQDADQIRFPLDPSKQLVLTRGTGTSVLSVGSQRVMKCNADLADACEQVIIGHPDRPAQLDQVELRDRGPQLRFNEGPLIGPGNQEKTMLHLWTTRR